MKSLLSLILLLSLTLPASAACSFDEVIGYTLAAKKVVVGFIENDKREDTFSGCKVGRTLVFEDNTAVKCMSYTYHHAQRPTAYLFASAYATKLCIDGIWFDAASLR